MRIQAARKRGPKLGCKSLVSACKKSGIQHILRASGIAAAGTGEKEDGFGHISTGGSYFLNVVGTIYEPVVPPVNPDDPWPAPVPREGFWGRLRLNGTPETMPGFDPAITQYVYQQGDMDTPGGWVNAADGTPAPEWVATVGVIA